MRVAPITVLPMPRDGRPYTLLAHVRRALRALNAAIDDGCRHADLSVQQQAFLLALAARPDGQVLYADVRIELQMDEATASELVARLVARKLVSRRPAADRRAWCMKLTASGRARLERSIEATRHAIQHAESRGELAALRDSLSAYLDYYTLGSGTRAKEADRAGPRRPPALRSVRPRTARRR